MEKQTVVLTNTIEQTKAETPLRNLLKGWKKVLSDGLSGPLRLAPQIVEIAANWNRWKEDPDAVDFARAHDWAKARLAQGMPYWNRRARAAARLGPDGLNRWDHHAAIWAVETYTSDADLKKLRDAVFGEYRELGNNPPSKARVARLAAELFGKTPAKRKKCPRCAKLEALRKKDPALDALLQAAGIERC